MSESKHTPGPWTYGVRKNGTIWFSLGDSVKGPHWQADLNAREPDARLMMAAPDLLAEYKRAIAHIHSFLDIAPMDATTETHAILYCADRLIAKAEGRS